MTTPRNTFDPFAELTRFSGAVAGVGTSWRVVWGRLCLASFGAFMAIPYFMLDNPESRFWEILWGLSALAVPVCAAGWFIASRRQEAKLAQHQLDIDVRDLPKRDPTAFGSGAVRALKRWGIVMIIMMVVVIALLSSGLPELLRESEVAAFVFIVVLVVASIGAVVFILQKKPTDVDAQFAAFASRNGFQLEKQGMPVWVSELLSGLDRTISFEWSLSGWYGARLVEIVLVRQPNSSAAVYVVRIDDLRLPTGDDTLRAHLAACDAIIYPTPGNACVLYVAGRNQTLSQANFIRLFAAVDVAIKHGL